MSMPSSLHDLQRLERLYSTGFHDAFLDNALHKVLERQIARDEADLDQVDRVLAQYEQQYGISSVEFWQRYQGGQMPDSGDYVEWSVYCKMRQRILERLHILREDNLNG